MPAITSKTGHLGSCLPRHGFKRSGTRSGTWSRMKSLIPQAVLVLVSKLLCQPVGSYKEKRTGAGERVTRRQDGLLCPQTGL